MSVVWKYPLELTLVQTITTQVGAEPRLVDFQGPDLTLWLEVDPDNDVEDRTIIVAGTGQEIPMGYRHLGSVQRGAFVWHVYWMKTVHEQFRAVMAGAI